MTWRTLSGRPWYAKLKEERSQVLWRAVEKAIPDVRRRVEVQMVGTPVTQARFMRRQHSKAGGSLRTSTRPTLNLLLLLLLRDSA